MEQKMEHKCASMEHPEQGTDVLILSSENKALAQRLPREACPSRFDDSRTSATWIGPVSAVAKNGRSPFTQKEPAMRKANLIAVFIAFVLALTGAAPSVLAASKSSPKTSPTKVMSGVVNINTATVDQIAKLPGIGPSLAAKIVQRRMSKPFSSPGELMEVKGIGKRKFQSMSQYVSVSGKTTFSVQKAKSPETAKQYKGGKSAKRASSTAEKPLSMNVAPGVLLAHRA